MHPAYILSGGRSQRFGSDKARHVSAAGIQLNVLANQLRSAGHTVHIVADRADRYADLGLTCLVDVQPNRGPLAGLVTALEHHRAMLKQSAPSDRAAGWLLLVNCDQRLWQAAWYAELSAQAQDRVDASVYFDTLWQPLPGMYHIDLLPQATDRLNAQQLSLHGLLDAIGVRVAKRSTARPPAHWSFNTPADLERGDE